MKHVKIDGSGKLSLRNRKYLRKFQPIHGNNYVPKSNVTLEDQCPITPQSPYTEIRHTPVKPFEITPPDTDSNGEENILLVPQPLDDSDQPSTTVPDSSLFPPMETTTSQTNDLKNTVPSRRSTIIRNSPNWHTDYVLS